MGGRRAILLVPAIVGVAMVAFLVVGAAPGFGLLARVLLAGVFLVAGVAKLRDRASFADTLEGFGIRGSLVPALSVLLPVLEVAVAGALLVPVTSSAGAVGALGLLLLFLVAVGVALAWGRTADCGCFGKDRAGRLSVLTLLRNGVLAGLAGAIAVGNPGGGAVGRLPSLASLAVVGLVAFVALGLLAARNSRREPTDEPHVSVAVPSAASEGVEAALTRRRWMRVAGGAGLAGAIGSSLGWPELAGACARLKLDASCAGWACIRRDPRTGCCVGYGCFDCSGFAGGGVVRTPSGSAQASFFGNKPKLKGSRQQVIGGALVWFDPAWQGTGLLLQAARITGYRRVPGSKIRELTGFASANGNGKHPFVLRVLDAGKPGSGADTVSLHVSGVAASGAGGASGEYAADGHLAQGDLTVNLQATTILV